MKNTMDFNNKTMQAAAVAVMNDVLSSDAEGKTMDDVYKTVCKYVDVSKEQFDDLFKQAGEKLDSWKNEGKLSHELCDEDLDMVVGGSAVGDFFCMIGNGIAEGAKAVGNFVKEHAVEIAIVAGCMLVCTGIGAGLGVAFASLAGAATTSAAVGGGVIGSSVGLWAGVAIGL